MNPRKELKLYYVCHTIHFSALRCTRWHSFDAILAVYKLDHFMIVLIKTVGKSPGVPETFRDRWGQVIAEHNNRLRARHQKLEENYRNENPFSLNLRQ
jgi:hypothetical protein